MTYSKTYLSFGSNKYKIKSIFLKDTHVTLKSHLTVKKGHGQASLTNIFMIKNKKNPSFK